jgi:hypothetical protein
MVDDTLKLTDHFLVFHFVLILGLFKCLESRFQPKTAVLVLEG